MKYLWTIPVVVTTLLVAACSNDDSEPVSAPSSFTTNTAVMKPPYNEATVEPPSTPSLSEAELEAEQKAIEQEAAKRVAVIEQTVKTQPTIRGRLDTIVTVYCKASWGDMSQVDKAEVRALERLYDKYWQAGNAWVRPLDSAAKQTKIGACPDVDTSMNVYAPSVG